MKKIYHDNIVKLVYSIEDNKCVYLIMELLEGESLKRFIKLMHSTNKHLITIKNIFR